MDATERITLLRIRAQSNKVIIIADDMWSNLYWYRSTSVCTHCDLYTESFVLWHYLMGNNYIILLNSEGAI